MKTGDIHVEIEEWMAGALCGGLDVEEQELFDRHLAECEACRAVYREEQLMNTMLEKEMGDLRPEPEFGDAMVRRFRERVGRKRRGAEWLGALGRLAWGRPAQALYALLVLGAMVKTGSMLTGEGEPMGGAAEHQDQVATLAEMQKAQQVESAQPAPAVPEAAPAMAAPVEPPLETKAAPGDADSSLGMRMVGASADRFATASAGRAEMAKADSEAPTQLNAAKADAAASSPGAQASATEATAPTPDDQRKLIRDATVHYEVADYAKAVDTVTTLIAGEQGYVATQNSDRGANGKLEGTIEVKVLPDHLDAFLMKLWVLGDLKSQQMTAQDVTKEYFDTDARMRNAQEEEAQLLDILKNKTGKLAEVLQVERELARVRQSIEQMQGTLKYYNTMAAYATVTIGLSEKDLNAPAQYLLKQRDELSIYSGDVEATFARAKGVAQEAKAQILDSDVERDSNGQTTATLSLLIDPDAGDGAIAKLKGLGRIQNFTSRTERVAQDGTGTSDTAGTEKDKVEAHLTVLQDQETAAQQTDVGVLTKDVESRIEELKAKAPELGAEVKGASFQHDPSGTENGTVELRMPLRAYQAVLAEVQSLGEVKNLSVHRDEGATDTAPADMSVTVYSQEAIVADDNGIWATVRRTMGEAFGAVMWSVRMIGVSLAFFAPWLLVLAVVACAVKLARRMKRKSE